MKTILVTGGTGYIGSHTVVELLHKDYQVVIVDNLSNSNPEVLNRIREITGKEAIFHQVDLLDREALEAVFSSYAIDAVIHFAGLKAVGESVQIPLRYYHNNIAGTLVLLELMQKYQVCSMVFSSSATVYGNLNKSPFSEEMPLSATNPYGSTKVFIEQILKDLQVSSPCWRIAILRYFNPVGAHPSGLMGEDPNGIPNNLMPFITQVAIGKRSHLNIFGKDYDTPDGTGVRDYIHVCDLARGHIMALEKIKSKPGVYVYNLGTGKGYSVIDVVKGFEKASGKTIPYQITDRRPGDIAWCYADPSRANNELGWKAEHDLSDMCRDSWNWQSKNPNGY